MALIKGRWGLPVPHRKPLLCVVGKPIEVQLAERPSQAHIDSVHAQFVGALTALFDEYKAAYGEEWRDRKLIIR